MAIDPEAASRAIHQTRDGLAAAGYAIDVEAPAGELVFSVRAQDGACEDCLVPKPIFVDILGRELADAGLQVASFQVVYPLDDE
jgi:hypothetical protein